VPWIDEEQVKQAKEVDLLTYLQQNEPHELIKSKYGTDEYRTKAYRIKLFPLLSCRNLMCRVYDLATVHNPTQIPKNVL